MNSVDVWHWPFDSANVSLLHVGGVNEGDEMFAFVCWRCKE